MGVRPYEGYPDPCPRPCVALLPLAGGLTVALESNVNQRLTVASVGGKAVVVLETEPLDGGGFSDTEQLLKTLRIRMTRG